MKSNKSKQKKNKKNKKNKNKKEGQTEKKRGRPTKYRPEFCQMMVEWFDRELTEIVECERATSNGAVVTIKEEKPIRPPMFGEFARKVLKVYHQTMLDWVKKYEEFNEAYKECKTIQREFIVMNCLLGHYNSSFGRFTMKNISDWRDQIQEPKDEQEKTGLVLAYSLNED